MFAFIYVCAPYVAGPIICPGNGITDGFEKLCRCWVLDPGPLKKHQELLTAEPSL